MFPSFVCLVLFLLMLQTGATNNTTVIVTEYKNYSTTEPTWITSNFFRAGNEQVISSFTGSSQWPFASYTFTFSSALPGIPEIAYGIQRYRGNDYLKQQFYEIRMTGLTAATFSVEIQIFGYTNLWMLAVAYLAVDPTFPHHYNSFDNVPINYTAGDIVNISTSSASMTYYTNYINYTQQAAGRTFTTFAYPLSSNKIVIFMTSLWIRGSDGSPVKFHIYPEVISSQFYMWNITVQSNVIITNVHYSQIIFNADDVESSQRYYIVYDRWYTDLNGGFLTIPAQFIDNFIMGVTSFEAVSGGCGFEAQWLYTNQTVGGVNTFGVQMLYSWTKTNKCGFSWLESSLLYMMTWLCDPPFNYFNLTTRECQTECGAFYVANPSNYTCMPCANNTCYQCTDPNSTVCDQCASYLFRELVGGDCVCMSGYLQANSLCQPCDSVNPGCLNCTYDDGAGGSIPYNSSYFACIQCNTTVYGYSDVQACMICLVTGCANCSVSDGTKCTTCDLTNGFFLNASTQQCFTVCGDGLVGSPLQSCDDNNTDDYDGCSSVCQVEVGFSCPGAPSTCLFDFNASLTLSNQNIENQSIICNTITFDMALSPAAPLFDLPEIDWTHFLYSPNSSLLYQNTSLTTYSNGILTVSYFLLGDLQNSTLVFQANFSQLLPNSTVLSNTSAPSLIFTVNTTPQALMSCCTGFELDLINGNCSEICGDGLVFVLPCDDGNLIDGDGCSSSCQIQTDYTCVNGSETSPSVCGYTGSSVFSLKTGDKHPDKNSMTLTYDLGASSAIIKLNNGSTDITSMINFPSNSGVTVKSAYIDPVTNELVVQIDYTEDLQDQKLLIQITPPASPSGLNMSNITNTWIVNPTNQLKAKAYSQDEYAEGAKIAVVADVILGAFMASMFISIGYRRFIGLELASLIQFGYLSMLENKEITVYAWPIATWKYVFGYNQLYFSDYPTQRFMFPHHIIGYQPNFGFSNNLMLIIACIIFFLALLFLIFSLLTQKGTATRIRYISSIIASEPAYTLVVFLSPNIITAICLQANQGILFKWDLVWSKIFLIVAVLLCIIAHIVNTKMAHYTVDVGTFLRKGVKSSIHMPVVFNIRLFLLSIFLFLYHLNSSVPSYLVLAVQLSYIIYVISCIPHLRQLDFIRSLFVELGLLWILTMRLLQINIIAESEDSSSQWFPAIAYLQYVIYLVCIVISFASYIYHCCRPSQQSKAKINHELFESKEKFESSLQQISVYPSNNEVTNEFSITQSMQKTITAEVTRTFKIIDHEIKPRARKFRSRRQQQ